MSADQTAFGISKLNRRLHRLVWVYSCQNATLLEITCRMHILIGIKWLPCYVCSFFSKTFHSTWSYQGGTSFVDPLFFSVLSLLCLCARLFTCPLWTRAGKGLNYWLSFVVSNCEFVTFPLVSWVRCGTWLYRLLTKDTNGKVTNSQLDTTNESQEVSPFPAGDHKAHINRRAHRHSKHKTEQKHKRSTKEVPPWNGQ